MHASKVTSSVVKCLKMISEKLDQVFVCHKIACFCIYKLHWSVNLI